MFNEHVLIAIVYSVTIISTGVCLVVVAKRIADPLWRIYDVLDDIKQDRRRR